MINYSTTYNLGPNGLTYSSGLRLWAAMKAGIHPEYKEVKVHCGCGAEHRLYSTRGDMQVEICSQCHPFYTGQHKVMDTAGRVDRFKRKYKLK